MSDKIQCYNCKYVINQLGNFTSCKLLQELDNTIIFIDFWYWNTGAPDECPLKKEKKINE